MSSILGLGFSRFILCMGLLGTTLMGLASCGSDSQAPTGPGRVAVVDMRQIALAAGLETRMSQLLQEAQTQEQAQLQALQKQLGLDPEKPPTAEEAQSETYQQARMQLSQAIAQAQQRLQAIEFNELEQFRNMVRPIALRVANAQGCTIVMELREGMLSVDPASNITDEVITELPLTSRGSQTSPGPQSTQPTPQTGMPAQPGFALPPNQPGGQPSSQPMTPGSQPASPSSSSDKGLDAMGGYLGSEGQASPQATGSGTQQN